MSDNDLQNRNDDSLWYDLEDFASMTGFAEGLETLENTKKLKWTNTATDMQTGGIHGLRYKVEQGAPDALSLSLQHWVHWPGGTPPTGAEKKRQPQILRFEARLRQTENGRVQVQPVAARWMGKDFTALPDLIKFMHLLQETGGAIRDNIAHNTNAAGPTARPPHDSGTFPGLQRQARQIKVRDEIPNLYNLTQRCGIKAPFTLEGMYFNCEFNFSAAAQNTQAPLYPLQLLQTMLGLETDITRKNGRGFSRSHTVPNTENGGYEGATYSYEPVKSSAEEPGAFTVSCKIWDTDAQGQKQEQTLYNVSFAQEGDDPKMYRLTGLEMLGHKPDINNHKGVARALRAMKYGHLAIQRGEAPLFSKIIHDHDLKTFLGRPPAPPQGADRARTSIQVFGANNDAVFSEKEKSIGSNGMVVIKDFMKDDQWVRQGIGVDWGVTFGDGEKEYYHTISHNYGRYLRNPASPHIHPYVETIANLETHEHEDHLRGVARLAKFGFALPPLVVNQHTKRVLRRMMSEEGVPADKIAAITARCHVMTIDRHNKPEADKQHFEYGDTVIEQGYETIYSQDEQCKKYFPTLDIYSKQHPKARSHVRVGPAGHSAHALMFEVDGILYTGDYKLDQTIPARLRTDMDWLEKCRDSAAVHIQESTNAPKASPSNAPIAEVFENRKKILRAEKDGRVLYDTIGSNAVDIEMICRAAGEVRQEELQNGVPSSQAPYEAIIFAGSAVRNKYSDLNTTDNFKNKMKTEYGIKTMHIDSKGAKELLAQDPKKASSYLVVMTGTQDEELSVSHRVSRDLHEQIRLRADDVIMRGQVPIPGEGRHDIRRAQNNRYRHDFGCKVYDAYELAQQDIHIYTSSHASQDDYRQIHEKTGGLFKLLHHGGPPQLQAMQKIMDEIGAQAIIPDKQVIYQIDHKNKKIDIIGETPEERVAFREISEEFYKKHRQQATVDRVKDHWQGDVAARMYRYEDIVSRHSDERHLSSPANRGANIAEQFNHVAGKENFPPIGIRHPEVRHPYYQHHKNIHFMIGMDTETTGVNPQIDMQTDISFTAANMDGDIVAGKTIKHALPRYLLPTAGAMIVTHNDDPDALYRKGLKLRKYVHEIYKTYREWPQELAKDKDARAIFAGYRNGVFDDPITMRMMGMALAAKDMKPMSTYGNLQLDVYNLYSAMIAFMPDQTGAQKDADGYYQRTLRTACLTNGVEYDDEKAHGSLYDAERVIGLFNKFKQITPDLCEQMIMNCDFSASRRSPMIDHILGHNMHFNDQAPVFGFVDMRDRTCTPQLGALVTIDTEVSKATDAIVVNLAKGDIHQLEQLPDHKLLETMDDPDGPFAVIKLNNTPCLVPPDFIYRDAKVRAKAVGNMPKTTLQARANALKHIRSSSSSEVGNNFIQRVQRLYAQSKLCRHPEKPHPAFQAANNNRPAKDFRTPAERIFSLFHVIKGINQIKSRHYKKAALLLRDIQPQAQEFKRGFDRETFWKDALQRAHELSAETNGQDPYIEDLRFLIEWQIDDINPQWLPPQDKQRVNALKSSMLHGPDNAHTNTVAKFVAELSRIENDPAQFEKLIGKGPEAQEKWDHLKQIYLDFAGRIDGNKKYVLSDKKRETLRAYRRAAPPAPPSRFPPRKPGW